MASVNYFLFGALCIGLSAGNILSAQEENLWNYAMPSADAIVYFNTKQAAKAMTPALWERIQKDKNKALEEDSEEQFFDTKDRDAEAVINLFISSVVPCKATLEGVAVISGNVKGDIAKLLQAGKDSDAATPQIMKQNDLNFYQYKFDGDEKIPPANFTFSLDQDGLLHFRADVSPDKGQTIPFHSGNLSGKPTLVTGMAQKDLSFAAAVRTEKFLTIPASSPEAGKLKDFLGKLNTVLVTGRVQDNFLQISIVFSAKNSLLAGELHQAIQPVLEQLALGFSQQIEGLSVNVKNNDILLSGNINIAVAWNLISRITKQQPQQQLSPQ